MTKKEIDEAFKSGTKIGYRCYIRKTRYFCGEQNISSKQFSEVLRKFKDQYDLKSDFGGITIHTYTYKSDSNG